MFNFWRLSHSCTPRKKKPPVPQAGSCHRFLRLRLHAFDHGLDQRAWGEVFTGAALGVFRVLLQRTFVKVALKIFGGLLFRHLRFFQAAAVWPVTAKTSLFWMVAKKVLAVCALPS
nr:hypothetical protein [Dyella sp. M7H15-1]